MKVRIHISKKKTETGRLEFVDISNLTVNGYLLKYDYYELTKNDFVDVEYLYDFIIKNIDASNYYFLLPTESIEWYRFMNFYKFLINFFKKRNLLDKLKIIDNNIGAIPTSNNKYYQPILGMLTWNELGVPWKEISERTLERNFVSLNRRPKKHRRDLVEFITNNKLENKFHYSYLGSSEDDNLRHVIDFVDIHGYRVKDWEVPGNFNIKSFCDIVTESENESIFNRNFELFEELFESDSKLIHLTEKVGKPLLLGQPFILISGPFYLKKLKELGFKTFDNWWDESYDLEEDYSNRMKIIYNNILNIYQWDLDKCKDVMLEMNSILIHNHLLLKKYKLEYDTFSQYDWVEFDIKKGEHYE